MTNISSSAPDLVHRDRVGARHPGDHRRVLSQVDEAPLAQLEEPADERQLPGRRTTRRSNSSSSRCRPRRTRLSAPNAFASAVVGELEQQPRSRPRRPEPARHRVRRRSRSISSPPPTRSYRAARSASANDVVASGDSLLVRRVGRVSGSARSPGSGLDRRGAHDRRDPGVGGRDRRRRARRSRHRPQITSSNDQLSVSIDGTPSTFTIADGTYTAQQLAAAIDTASGGLLTARRSARRGSSLSRPPSRARRRRLQIGRGSANAALGISAGRHGGGTDGVDHRRRAGEHGQRHRRNRLDAGRRSSRDPAGRSRRMLSPGGLSVGSVTAQNVSVGNGSLVIGRRGDQRRQRRRHRPGAATSGQNKYALSVTL